MNNIIVDWDEYGKPVNIKNPNDSYQMNWLSSYAPYKTGEVRGFCFKRCEKTSSGVRVTAQSAEGVRLTIDRRLSSKKYIETYTFLNTAKSPVTLNKDFGAISYAGNSFFDKKPDMLFTRCNTHIFTGEDITYLYSIKLCGKPPYLYVRAEQGSFSGYGLAADIALTPMASFDRGQIWIFPKTKTLKPGEKAEFILNYHFVNKRPENTGFHCSLNKYSLFMGETVKLYVHTKTPICDLSVTCSDRKVSMNIKNTSAEGIIKPKKTGEYRIKVCVNGKNTWLSFCVLPKLSEILEKRAAFICFKQQCENTDSPLHGAYLIYNKKTGDLVYEQDFPDHNAARERLSMGVTVALALQQNKSSALSHSLKLYRDFLEREIVNVKTGEVKNGVNDARTRLYNYPWVSTFYFELYKATGDITALQTAADVMIHYYSVGGENMESHVEIHRLLPFLKKEKLENSYQLLLAGFLKHADSIVARRNDSSSPEVSCANGMMSMMGVILINAFLLTNDKKYLAPVEDVADIVGNFYALQPDFHCYGMAVRFWDLYWFGESRVYGDTFPQWLCANTAEFYAFYDKAFKTHKHSRLIREILLGCCSVYDEDGFGSCGYLYPDEVIAYSSDPARQEKHRPIGKHSGKFYDSFANDQDWSLYYAYTLLPEKYLK
mgnify:CR=1 FL=1